MRTSKTSEQSSSLSKASKQKQISSSRFLHLFGEKASLSHKKAEVVQPSLCKTLTLDIKEVIQGQMCGMFHKNLEVKLA